MAAATDEQLLTEAGAIGWRAVAQTLTRPYRVTIPMVILVMLVPLYLVIARAIEARPLHAPVSRLDVLFPLQPVWALVYGALYMFLIVLPVLVIRQEEHIRRTVFAYLMVWIASYVCFVVYPTGAPRPARVIGDGFAVWGLKFLYDADPPFNCFPSIHVAHSFVSAFACHRVNRRVGTAALVGACLVALSTLFTKQHYVADVVAGITLAAAANVVFLRGYPREKIPALDTRVAPSVAVATLGVIGLGVASFWAAYLWSGRS